MRKIKVEEAVGQTLCHDMTAILENGYKGVRFKRGHLIAEEDIPVLVKNLCYGDGRDGTISGFVTLNEDDCTKIYQAMI